MSAALTKQELLTHKKETLKDLKSIEDVLANTLCLNKVFDQRWIEAVRNIINGMESELRYSDQKYHMFRILRDEHDITRRLDSASVRVEALAKKTQRLKHYRETVKKLRSSQTNQIQAAIFELLVLARLIDHSENSGHRIEPYQRIGQTQRNVDARVFIDKLWCNFEAKALGYSQHDVGMRAGGSRVSSHGIESMDRQIYDALYEKSKQLSGIPVGEPNVVVLTLGYNADRHTAPEAIQQFLRSPDALDLSGVVLFESFLCKKSPRLFFNTRISCKRRVGKSEKAFVMHL